MRKSMEWSSIDHPQRMQVDGIAKSGNFKGEMLQELSIYTSLAPESLYATVPVTFESFINQIYASASSSAT
jgi:hypothetical protein